MKYNIVLTEQAVTDLRGIYEYIAFTLLDPEIAARQLDRIENAILGLDELPKRFRVFEKEPWLSRELCQMPVDNFLVFYIPKAEDNIHFFHFKTNSQQLSTYSCPLFTYIQYNKERK